MRAWLFVFWGVLLPFSSYAQGNIQTHKLSFQNADGIYGVVTIKTQPYTMGFGYIKVACKGIRIEGLRKTDPLTLIPMAGCSSEQGTM